MKKTLITLAAFSAALTAHAQVVFNTDLSATQTIEDLGSIGNDQYVGVTTGTPTNTFTTNANTWQVSGLGLSAAYNAVDDTVDFVHAQNAGNRSRSGGFFIDMSSAPDPSAGNTFNYTINISSFDGGDVGDTVVFQAYALKNIGAFTYGVADFGVNADGGELSFNTLRNSDDGGAGGSSVEVVTAQEIVGTGNLTGTITLADDSFVGADDWLYFAFSSRSASGGASNPSFSINSVNVTAVPEPSVYALLSGLLAISFVMVRRRK